MLIIPEEILFKHATAQYVSDRKPFDHQMEVPDIIKFTYYQCTSIDYGVLSVEDYRYCMIDHDDHINLGIRFI